LAKLIRVHNIFGYFSYQKETSEDRSCPFKKLKAVIMNKHIFLLPFVLMVCSAYSQTQSMNKEAAIDSIMRAHLVPKGKKPVHSFLLYAKNNQTGFEVHNGVGTIGRDDTPVDMDFQYNCASITKTVVATIILQLQEEGKLSINEYANKYLKSAKYPWFDKIHIYRDTVYSNAVTIKMLLNHTSGIADIFTDAATRFNISVLLHKKRQFTPQMVMHRFMKYNLNKKPANKPGQGNHYSDINYMLLGFIIEEVTQQTLAQAIRQRILEPLAMSATYFEYYEPAAGDGKRIDAFLNKINMTKNINTSYEWGGGGIVSTTHDLAVFLEALFDLKLYQDQATLDMMLNTSDTEKYSGDYGLGIIKYKVDEMVFYGHGGFYGSLLVWHPDTKTVFSANIAQALPPYDGAAVAAQLLNIVLK
jgi:D-alanyl-D-alanine carboxypeptidase